MHCFQLFTWSWIKPRGATGTVGRQGAGCELLFHQEASPSTVSDDLNHAWYRCGTEKLISSTSGSVLCDPGGYKVLLPCFRKKYSIWCWWPQFPKRCFSCQAPSSAPHPENYQALAWSCETCTYVNIKLTELCKGGVKRKKERKKA